MEMEYVRTKLRELNIRPDERLNKLQNSKPVEELKWAEKRCGFLAEDNTCKIYDIRPIVCRTHNSLDDPKFCDASQGKSSHQQQYVIMLEAFHIALSIIEGTASQDSLVALHEIS